MSDCISFEHHVNCQVMRWKDYRLLELSWNYLSTPSRKRDSLTASYHLQASCYYLQGLEVKVWRKYEEFIEELTSKFPHERKGIKKFYDECWRVFNSLNSLDLKSLEEPRYLLGGKYIVSSVNHYISFIQLPYCIGMFVIYGTRERSFALQVIVCIDPGQSLTSLSIYEF